jgi:hypothetical protein
MQVSQLVELDTHAVIGGGKARSFSMSDSAEFFTVLSDTLYRDKKRAVVREVICNGWDAHIMNDCTDTYLEVTLTEDEIIFKDFGPGIADEKIVPIYCVYGASTKVRDANQTGGFGLGSKSPFAYSDHFTVTSCFEGMKRVYAISRGGTETEGRPEIREMVSVPTTETGITVTIPLRDKSDLPEFQQNIFSVAYQGGMKVKLNGRQLATLNYEPARKQGFCAIENVRAELRESYAYLLYGTVLYPITTTDARISEAALRAGNLVGNGYRLVLIAPPNSVGITPSRESLSYSELTTQTILRLLKRATKSLEASIPSAGKKIITRLAATMELDKAGDGTMQNMSMRQAHQMPQTLVTPEQIAAYTIRCDFDRIPRATRRKWIYDGLAKKYPHMRATLRKARGAGVDFSVMTRQHAHTRFVRLAVKTGLLNGALIYDDNHSYHGTSRLDSIRRELGDGAIGKNIYVAPNRRELTSMIVGSKSDPTSRSRNLYLGLVVGQKPSRDLLDRLRTEAKTFGFTLDEYDWEFVKPKVVRKQKASEKFHAFVDYRDKDKTMVEPSLEAPKFFMRGYTYDGELRLGIDDHGARHILAEMYPELAVITTKEQEQKLRAAGVVHVIEDVEKRLAKMVKCREVQYGLMVQDRNFCNKTGLTYYYESYKLCETALALARLHMDIARLIFPDRAKPGEKWKEARQLVRVMRTFPHSSQNYADSKEAPASVLSKLENAARETFKDMIVTKNDAAKRLGYLSVLIGSEWITDRSSLDEPARDKLIGVIRYLQRFADKSKLTVKHTNTIAQKEAA